MKGHTNNPAGRPKGTPNKATKTIRRFVEDLIRANTAQIKRDIKAVTPKERLLILEKYLQYVIPKQQALNIDKLTDEQINEIVENLTNSIENEDDTTNEN